jgi:hypothetical protein
VARDQTGRKSSVSLGALITHEDDLVASGPDDNFTRIGNDSTFSEWAPSADGATTFFSQWRVRPNAATTHSVNPATLTQAGICSTMPFVASSPAESGGYGSFQHCINADGGESTGVYDAVSGTLSFNTVGSVSSGQPALVFSYGTNINAGQRVTGSGNIPPGTTVDAVYQCAPTSPLSGCGGVTNETLIVLSANLTGTVANNTSLTFTGVFNDGSYFNGIFSDAFASWTNQTAKGLIKAGTLNNTGTTLTLTGFGEDSTNTTGIDYGDINWKITTNTHGATLGEINLANAGVTIGSPTGGNEGAGSLNVAGTIYQNGVAVGSGTLGTTGSPANGNLAKFSGSATITNGDLSGDCTTSGTLAVTCSGLAPKANPTFAGIVTLPDGSTAGAAWTIATAMAMGGHGMTAAGALIGQATSGPEFFGASTASSTVPTFAPNRASANTGIGAQASGNISLIAGGTEIERITSSGIILEGGAYFSGATSGVTCSGSPTGSFASTNGIVTHC